VAGGAGAALAAAALIGGDALFVIHLALMVGFTLRITPDGLRRRADVEDEGIPLIVPLAPAAVVLSLAAIFALPANSGPAPGNGARRRQRALGLGDAAYHRGIPLRAPLLRGDGEDAADAGGLDFPGTQSPARGTSPISRSSSA
jgi:hypothetical protein